MPTHMLLCNCACVRSHVASLRRGGARPSGDPPGTERANAQEKLNGAITELFSEPQFPEDPTDFIASRLCAAKLAKADESLSKVRDLEKEIKKLKSELRELKK